jgi:hypothetical protein
MHSTNSSYELWVAAHRLACEAERSLSAKLRARVAVHDDDVKLVVEHRANASHLLKVMLSDMEAHARSVRTSTGPGLRAWSPGAASSPDEARE